MKSKVWKRVEWWDLSASTTFLSSLHSLSIEKVGKGSMLEVVGRRIKIVDTSPQKERWHLVCLLCTRSCWA